MSPNIRDIETENSFNIGYQLPLFEIILKLIIYFQPFDTKLPNIESSNLKSNYIILTKDSANTFITNNVQDLFNSQMGNRVNIQIRKQMFTKFQNLREWKKTVDHI
ncbi:MAG: hypothetical protein GPJ54_01155 [Candidatus Heimdallarchaeota archaeon]|nr:hypothetical protein [Candidatus Heimdallarchaeota archaeon]